MNLIKDTMCTLMKENRDVLEMKNIFNIVTASDKLNEFINVTESLTQLNYGKKYNELTVTLQVAIAIVKIISSTSVNVMEDQTVSEFIDIVEGVYVSPLNVIISEVING